MEKGPWKVLFFQTDRGEYPVIKFIKSQDKQTHARILQSINLLKTTGPFLKPPYIKKLIPELYELRITGKIQIRILYTFHHNQYFLLHAFTKKSQKTPRKELQVGIDRMKQIK